MRAKESGWGNGIGEKGKVVADVVSPEFAVSGDDGVIVFDDVVGDVGVEGGVLEEG